jgi:hypothetical protein
MNLTRSGLSQRTCSDSPWAIRSLSGTRTRPQGVPKTFILRQVCITIYHTYACVCRHELWVSNLQFHVQQRAERRNRFLVKSSAEDGEDTPRSQDNGGRNQAVAIPEGLRTAGSVFVLAGFLKVLIICFPFSTMAISMYFQGLCDLGTWAAIKMMPFAIGILALAKVIVDRKIHERKFASVGIAVCGVIALFGSRWAFARPRPSPLDPALAHYQKVRAYESSIQKAKEDRERNMKRELDPKRSQGAGAGLPAPRSRFS